MPKTNATSKRKSKAQKVAEQLEMFEPPKPLRPTNALMMAREDDRVFEVDATPEAVEVFCSYGFRFVRWL